MIEGELQIGSILLKSGKDPLIKDIPPATDKYLIVIDIDTKNNIIQIERQNIDGDIVEILKNKQKKSKVK